MDGAAVIHGRQHHAGYTTSARQGGLHFGTRTTVRHTEQTNDHWSAQFVDDYWQERGSSGKANNVIRGKKWISSKNSKTASHVDTGTAVMQLVIAHAMEKQVGERRADPAAVEFASDNTAKHADQVEEEISTKDPDFNISESGASQGYTAIPDITSGDLGIQVNTSIPTTLVTTLAALTDKARNDS